MFFISLSFPYTFFNNNTPHGEQRWTVLIRQLLHTYQWQQATQWATRNCFNQTIVHCANLCKQSIHTLVFQSFWGMVRAWSLQGEPPAARRTVCHLSARNPGWNYNKIRQILSGVYARNMVELYGISFWPFYKLCIMPISLKQLNDSVNDISQFKYVHVE